MTCRPERGTIVLPAAAFASIDEFPLRRRFLDPASGKIAPHFIDRIRPLTPAAATSLAGDAAVQCAESGGFTTTFRSDDSPGIVRERLRALPLPADAPIVVWWSGSTALATEWDLFASYWGDFCYPAADDVAVWPLSRAWALCYRRYEVFQFRRTPSVA